MESNFLQLLYGLLRGNEIDQNAQKILISFIGRKEAGMILKL